MRTLLLSFTLCLSLAALAGENKGRRDDDKQLADGRMPEFSFIEKHEKELNLTPEQKKKLDALKKKFEELRESMRKDPDTRELFKELKEAREAKDEAKLKALREKVREMLAKKSGGESILAETMKILAPEQLKKLKELREAEGLGRGEGMLGGEGRAAAKSADDPNRKPDNTKSAPKLYENEK